ncbi:phosphatase PAP2 family protein [Streptomyces sp. TRM64462]|uniref:phosphatase PAP2 family protein n=1 Tax=Streptomyces sp. TRM64462 TaxID=2741726 RepID=UPI0015868862|nr:phosphatase PAP2 family protein [Streptomyces sp. TRM64462]
MHPSTTAPSTPPDSSAPSDASRVTARARRVALWSGALAAVLLVLVAAEWGPLPAFDRAVADVLHASAVRSPAVTGANRVLSDWVWDTWTMRALAAVAVGVLWWRGERRWAVRIAGVSVLAALLQQALKAAVGRDRPQWPDPVDSAQFAAFPSGHAMTAAVTCGLLWWAAALCGARPVVVRAVVAAGAVSVLGVGLTRLYLGVHWVSDVVGGWLLGVCVVAATVAYGGRGVRKPGG